MLSYHVMAFVLFIELHVVYIGAIIGGILDA